MFIVYFATQLVVISKGLILHRNIGELPKSYLALVAFTLLGIGFIGSVAGFIYSKIFRFLPPYNLYLLTSAYLLFLNLFLVGWAISQKGTENIGKIQVSLNFTGMIQVILSSIIGGCIFAWMYQKNQARHAD
jgi:uncharacterized membrane protein YbjE (DUF340 family)